MTNKLFLIIFVMCCLGADAQKKWAGPVMSNWEDPLNWQPMGVPGIADDVVLDNVYQKISYKIILPNAQVNIHALSLEPAAGNTIEVEIPVADKAAPALIINDTGNSFKINSGGIFRNASGLSSGQSIQLNGTISIFNGGRYLHNSRSSHATEIVARLSAAPGTEKGIFEFDVPGGSYPISISNRTYGTLILSSDASGGVQTYNASGSNPVIINGDFQVNDGVQFNLDLTKDMFIYADYIQKGGVFNIASQANNNVVKIKGDISQSATGTITESSSGLPVIEFCGDHKQLLSLTGGITNSVTIKVNNPAGVTLISPLVLSYKLQLTMGKIKTGKTNILTLSDNCTASGGSVDSFVDGPLKKIGDDDFEFPVGKQGDYAPMKITGASGSVTDQYTGEYFLGSPESAYGYGFENPPIVRISKQEYWVLERSAGSSIKKVGVSVGNYSNATALEKLVLARWSAADNFWKNEGNSFYSGIATGTLVSNDVNTFGAFTLGSTVEIQNPLLAGEQKMRLTQGSNLQIKYGRNELVTMVIMDAGGRVVKILKVALSKGLNNVSVPLELPAKGVYILCLYDKRGVFLGCQRIAEF